MRAGNLIDKVANDTAIWLALRERGAFAPFAASDMQKVVVVFPAAHSRFLFLLAAQPITEPLCIVFAPDWNLGALTA
jgi:hypothetical protein